MRELQVYNLIIGKNSRTLDTAESKNFVQWGQYNNDYKIEGQEGILENINNQIKFLY